MIYIDTSVLVAYYCPEPLFWYLSPKPLSALSTGGAPAQMNSATAGKIPRRAGRWVADRACRLGYFTGLAGGVDDSAGGWDVPAAGWVSGPAVGAITRRPASVASKAILNASAALSGCFCCW